MGGCENITLALIKNTPQIQHVILVFSVSNDYQKFCIDQYGLSFINLNWLGRGLLRWRNWIALYKTVKAINPDLMHVNMYDASFYGRVIAFLLKIPTVMLVANTYSRKKVARGCVNFFLGTITKRVIAVGEDVKKDVLRFDRLPTSKVAVIPSFTILDYVPDHSQAIRKNLGIKQDDYVMLFIARLVEQKGISYLIEAVNICVNEFGANHLKLIIVGDGVLQGDLVKLTQKMRLTDHIFFVGEQRHLNGYLTESDCYTDSSLWAGLSLAAIKALEAGLPMIITDVGGARQLTVDGLYGKLCQPRSAESLASAIQHFYTTRPKNNFQATMHIQENFSDKALSNSILKIYQDALGKYE